MTTSPHRSTRAERHRAMSYRCQAPSASRRQPPPEPDRVCRYRIAPCRSPTLCRACGAPLTETFVDLGATPLANSYLEPDDADRMEPHYPLHARVCASCLLVQLPAVQTAEAIFSDYAYFSSYSDSWVEHARRYVAADRAGARRSATTRWWSRSPRTTATCCATSVDGRDRVLGVEPAAQRGGGGDRRRHRHGGGVLRPRVRGRPGRAPRARRPDRRQQRARPRARPERLRRRHRRAARHPRRPRHDRGAAPAAPDPRAAVRHHLPRALLLPVAARDVGRSRAATASPSSTSRSCRRTAARCATTSRTPPPGSRPARRRAGAGRRARRRDGHAWRATAASPRPAPR